MSIPERFYRIAKHKFSEIKDRVDRWDEEQVLGWERGQLVRVRVPERLGGIERAAWITLDRVEAFLFGEGSLGAHQETSADTPEAVVQVGA